MLNIPKNLKNIRKGYSLIEIMVSLAVLSIIMSMIISWLINFNRVIEKHQTNILLGNESEAMFRRFENQLSSSFGWINGTSNSLTFIRQNGDSVIAVWNPVDSMLYIDQARQFPAGVKVTDCRFLYMPTKSGALSRSPDLWLREVDLDDNEIVEGPELNNVVLVQVKIKLAKNTSWYEGSKNLRLPPAIVEVKLIE